MEMSPESTLLWKSSYDLFLDIYRLDDILPKTVKKDQIVSQLTEMSTPIALPMFLIALGKVLNV